MKTVSDLLKDADPLRDGARPSETDRERARAAMLAAAATSASARSQGIIGRRLAVAAVTAVIVGAALMPRLWSGGATLRAAAVRFEVRLAETAPTLDLQPARIAGSDRVVYLHRDAIATNDDIAAARVVPGNDSSQFHVAVTFTRTGAERMRAATADHIGRPLALLIDGEVVMAPTLRSAVSTDALLTGNYTREEADRIANGMLLR